MNVGSRATSGGKKHRTKRSRKIGNSHRHTRRARVARQVAGLNPGRPVISMKERARAEERERERQRQYNRALATAIANITAEAAISTQEHDLQNVEPVDFGALFRPNQNIAQMTAQLSRLTRAARVNQYLADQLQRSLETLRRDGRRNTALAEARTVLPLAQAAMRAQGELRPPPEGDRSQWRDIRVVLETLARSHGLTQDRVTRRWRHLRDDESPPREESDPSEAVALLEAILRSPPPGPFAKFKGFNRSPPSPSTGSSGFTFDPPPPPASGFNF